ncbi:ribbon-helix-helix protein, CopG family [Ruegeria arenilitoris]|uniref:ribbon-helix-helix protein, CopG family n=1 Tax=Ruegeria arenilitoris TaxID=1173585 RepID=UPI00147FFE56
MGMIADKEIVRVTASLPRTQELGLKELAAKNDVSVSWLIRHAVSKLLNESEDAQLQLDFGRRHSL